MAIQEVLVSKIFNYTSEPTKKVEGQFWFNPTTNILSRYDGTIWKPITVSSDDVAVLTDGNKVSLTNYLNTSIAALAEGIDTKQDKLTTYSEVISESNGNIARISTGQDGNITIGYNDPNNIPTTGSEIILDSTGTTFSNNITLNASSGGSDAGDITIKTGGGYGAGEISLVCLDTEEYASGKSSIRIGSPTKYIKISDGKIDGTLIDSTIPESYTESDTTQNIPTTKAVYNKLQSKQDKLKAGNNISIGSDDATISVSGVVPEATKATQDGNGNEISTWYATVGDLESKQNKLTAGDNIEIDTATNTISVTGIVPSAQVAGFADQATSDGFGNNIAETYATIGDLQNKQDISNLVTTINNTSDDIHYPSAKAVYAYAHASITSTTEITITPSSAQTATPITNALAKKARVVVTPSLSNNGAIYIKETTTYSSLNPIYPDPTNNVYEFSNMQNVNIFADFAGDSVDLTIEYRG